MSIVTVLPNFTVDFAQIEPTLTQHIQHAQQVIAQVVQTDHPTWDSVILPLEDADDALNRFFAPISHLNAVTNSPELRPIYERCLALLTDYHSSVGQNAALFRVYQSLWDRAHTLQLSAAQKSVLSKALRDFRLSGISLPKAQQETFTALQQRLSQLANQFENNVLDATDQWHYHTESLAELAGLPAATIAAATANAHEQQLQGYRLGLDFPTYYAVITYADNRALRQRFYSAYQTRASDQGPTDHRFNNRPIMQEMLALQHQAAQLLGFAHYAELSLTTKMAKTPAEVFGFLNELAAHSKPFGQRELQELQTYARQEGLTEPLKSWDVAYYSEKLQQTRYAISQEQLRDYFPLDQVLQGFFTLLQQVFGIQASPYPNAATWHPDVMVYQLTDLQRRPRGIVYCDWFARPNKRNGAWMDDAVTRRRLSNGDIQQPIAFLTCNFTPKTADKPACLTHDDVLTLFHEFGHCLHHLLSQVDSADISGIHGVAWDAIELPSQLMENFAWQEPIIQQISKHIQTGAPLPLEQLQQLQRSRGFQAGLQMLRQLEFALFDFHLYADYNPAHPADIHQVLEQVRSAVSLLPPPAFARFENSFSHIFAGGYAAGYYSYKWAEVLSADAFSRFEEEGILNPTTGRALLETILETGGSQEAMDAFIAFRGRKPNVQALLRHNQLTT